MGINFGIPHTECRPDETTIVNIALQFGLGDLNPHYFHYPTFYMYIIFFFYGLYYLFGRVFNKYAILQDLITEAVIDRTNFYLIARYISALSGIGTIFIVYKLTQYLFDEESALISSFFISFAYLHVRDSHFGVTDIFMTFLVVCTIFYIVKCYKNSSIRNYLFAGISGGLALSTKYSALPVIIPMFIVHYLNIIAEKKKIIKLLFDKRILSFIAVFIIMFLAGSPYILLDFFEFKSDFLSELRHFNAGHLINLGVGWLYHLKFSLFYGLGWSLFLSSLAGIVVLVKKDKKRGIILLTFPIFYYILMGRGYVVFVRYAIPLIPFLCITAALLVTYIGKKMSNKHGKYRYLLMWGLSFLIILPSINNIINFDKLLARKDNRLVLTEWITNNIPGGSSITQFGIILGGLQLYPAREYLEREFIRNLECNTKKIAIKARIDYMMKNKIEGYELWYYNSKISKFTFCGEIKDSFPDFIIMAESPLTVYNRTAEGINNILESYYNLKKSFVVIDINNKENLFDQQDAFFIPFTVFKDVKRPGPNFYIYERNDYYSTFTGWTD